MRRSCARQGIASLDGGPCPRPSGCGPRQPPSPLTRPSAERVHNGRRGGGGPAGSRTRPEAAAERRSGSDEHRTGEDASEAVLDADEPQPLVRGQGQGRSPPDLPASLRRRGRGVQRGSAPLGKAGGRAVFKTKKLHRACPVADLSSARFSGEAETTKRALVRIGRETGRMAAAIERGSSRRKWARDFLISRRQATRATQVAVCGLL